MQIRGMDSKMPWRGRKIINNYRLFMPFLFSMNMKAEETKTPHTINVRGET